jgi:hypothetical protein
MVVGEEFVKTVCMQSAKALQINGLSGRNSFQSFNVICKM